MTACREVQTELGGYVLGALEPAEAAAVREHLAGCAACAAEHARLAGLPALLALADGLEDSAALSPPRAVEERVLDAVARERGRPRARLRRRAWRPRTLALAGLAAAALGAGATALVLTGGEPAPARYDVTLRPAAGAAPASARAQLESVPGGTAVHLWVRDLPGDPSAVYEVRCEAPDWSASAGTFRVDTHGRAYVVLTTAARRGEYDAIRIVRRRRDPSGRPRTSEVLAARLS